jgi:hypothetical protein
MRSDRIDDRVGEHLVSRDANRLDFHGIHEGDVLVDAGRFDPRRQRVGWERCCPSSIEDRRVGGALMTRGGSSMTAATSDQFGRSSP